ncbi:MAG: YggU family protein [Nitrospirae bacterium]|nr:YggU family protein [Nitrospirota bacterium]
MELPYKKIKDGIRVTVKVEPRSSKRAVSGVMGDVIKVKLTAPPVDGAANEQLVEFLSETFRVKKSSIRIVKGISSKNKVVEITGISGI